MVYGDKIIAKEEGGRIGRGKGEGKSEWLEDRWYWETRGLLFP